MDKTYIGIDNGVSGTIGIIKEENYYFVRTPVVKVLDFHKEERHLNRLQVPEFMTLIKPFITEETVVYIERPFINKVGFTATISSVRCHEATLIALEQLGLKYKFIDSKEWQKYFFGNLKLVKNLKEKSLEVGNKIFPLVSSHKHNDRDGILIAQYIKENESKM